ncbi:MAG: pyrroline-5-carboxylate reductase [Clostridia bacterium]|nr:pyrroline-5-carboxylate reductase [Clostridia bacterium]
MKLGVIGAGNMSTAILHGVIKAQTFAKEDIYVSEPFADRLKKAAQLGVHATTDNREVVRNSDYIIFGVKPNVILKVMDEVREEVQDKVIISIAAGISVDTMKGVLGENAKIVRTMPNVAALVGEAMVAICNADNVSEEEMTVVKGIFESIGKIAMLPEYLINTATAANGSGPAYVFMMVEAMADAAVLHGIPRETAYLLVEQTILGSAKLALETGMHPGQLKDMVCSPGGTAIEAVYQLEQDGFRASLINAIDRCVKKADKMGASK